MDHDTKVALVKGSSVWGAVWLSHASPLEVAQLVGAALAAVYTTLLICEWLFKHWRRRR